jgi:hypothetical protein
MHRKVSIKIIADDQLLGESIFCPIGAHRVD